MILLVYWRKMTLKQFKTRPQVLLCPVPWLTYIQAKNLQFVKDFYTYVHIFLSPFSYLLIGLQSSKVPYCINSFFWNRYPLNYQGIPIFMTKNIKLFHWLMYPQLIIQEKVHLSLHSLNLVKYFCIVLFFAV